MSDLVKIIQDKKAEQRVLFNRFESIGNEVMKNIAAAKINILDEVLELANEVLTGSGQSNIPAVIKPVCKHEWHRTGDPDRQSCRCTKCGEYDG